MNIEKILTDHKLWLNGEGGKRANLSKTNLSCYNLHEVNLRKANLSGADLSEADLCEADLSLANLRKANLRKANLRKADLCETDLRGANLSGANLCWTNLCWTDLREADLSGLKGLLDPIEWIKNNFKTCNEGIIVYKCIGNTDYSPAKNWMIESGSILKEIVNSNRVDCCGCGVNFGTKEWCIYNYPNAATWKCLIRWEWVMGIVVPYNTDGKARCERLQLLEKV